MPTNNELYAYLVQIEGYLRKSLAESREEKIALLLEYARNSQDVNCARIAWAIEVIDGSFNAEIAKIKQQLEANPPPDGEEPAKSLYPGYQFPSITIDREMEFTP